MRRLVMFVVCLAAAACDATLEPEIASLTIESASYQLFPGDSTRFTAIAQDPRGDYIISDRVVWESSDTTVLRVLSDGLAIARRPGNAVVTLHLGASTAQRSVTVDPWLTFVEAGAQATCAFRHNGDLYCWGNGRSIGNIDDGSSIMIPRRVPTDLRFKQFSIGSRHMCAVTFEQRAYCWGSGEKGAVGDGSWWFQSGAPLAVASDLKFAEISAAWEHSCALTIDGIAFCWGRNGEGQLGTGDHNNKTKPFPVQTELRFKQLQAAGSNTCGLTVDGDMYCWGHRDYLGDTTITQHQTLPRRINVPKLRMFDSANDDPCGITLSDELYCWTNKVELVGFAGRVTDVTVGGGHICVVQVGGKVVCWGKGRSGELGDGTGQDSELPVEPAGNFKFVQIAAGGVHTCGITDAGATYCWGNNGFGQLGNGTTGPAHVPSRVLIVD